MDLVGKVALVTGGSGDIGAAICQALARAGVDVAVTYVGSRERAEATVAAVRARGPRARAVQRDPRAPPAHHRRAEAFQLDQREPASIAACAAAVPAAFGRLDILVNNGAWNIGIPFRDLQALDADIWDRILETNLRGPFLLARALAGELSRHKGGRIVNIASVAGMSPGGSSIAYASSKAGLIHLTHCLAVAMAPDVTVNCICPGLVEGTRMADRLPDAIREGARAQAVLGRTGSADEIGDQVVTFCRADSVTGQSTVVDGGMPAGMR